MNCKDKELNAKLYSNRATAHLDLGKKLLVNFLKTFKCIGFVRTVFVRTVEQGRVSYIFLVMLYVLRFLKEKTTNKSCSE